MTSGYSNILNDEIKIGTISNYKSEINTNFLEINVIPFVDFTNIYFVYILDRKNGKERVLIEKDLSN